MSQQNGSGPADFLMHPLPLSAVFNSYLAFFLPVIFYYFIARKYEKGGKPKIPLFAMEMLMILGVSWLFSCWLTSYAILDQCGNVNLLWTIILGLITPAFLLLGYVFIKYLATFLKFPLKGIFGWIKNLVLQDAFIIGFYMMLFSWMGSIITYFLAIKEGCKRNRGDMRHFKEEMGKRRAKMEEAGEELDEYEDDSGSPPDDEPENVKLT